MDKTRPSEWIDPRETALEEKEKANEKSEGGMVIIYFSKQSWKDQLKPPSFLFAEILASADESTVRQRRNVIESSNEVPVTNNDVSSDKRTN